jgi:hypothetical protein
MHQVADGDKICVGQHSADRDILVYDPAYSTKSEHVLFFSLHQGRERTFLRAIVRRNVAALPPGEARDSAILKYTEERARFHKEAAAKRLRRSNIATMRLPVVTLTSSGGVAWRTPVFEGAP